MRVGTTGPVGIVAVGMLLMVAGACTSSTDGPGSQRDATGVTDAAGSRAVHPSIPREMPPLPADPHAAMVEVRRLLAAQLAPLLADSGQRWTEVRFLINTSEYDETAYQGYLFVTVDWDSGSSAGLVEPPEQLAEAARARGWDDGGVSHLLNMARGPYHLRATLRPGNQFRYELTTPPLTPRTRIEGADLGADGVPELAAYRDGG